MEFRKEQNSYRKYVKAASGVRHFSFSDDRESDYPGEEVPKEGPLRRKSRAQSYQRSFRSKSYLNKEFDVQLGPPSPRKLELYPEKRNESPQENNEWTRDQTSFPEEISEEFGELVI